jgi:preprotein translocase subunit SecA
MAILEQTFANVKRHDPCPCGSGRKFNRCHGAPLVNHPHPSLQ